MARPAPLATLLIGAFLLSFPAMAVGAAWPLTWLFAVGAAVAYVGEWYLQRYHDLIIRALSKVHAGVTMRFLVRDGLLAVFIARQGDLSRAAYLLALLGVLGVQALRVAHTVAVYRTTRHRRGPVTIERGDAGPLTAPAEPPAFVLNDGLRRMLHLDVFAMIGAVVAAATDTYTALAAGLAVALSLGAIAVGFLALDMVRLARTMPSYHRAFPIAHDHVTAMKPEVLLYFSGSIESVYQVNMWLETLDALPQRTMVLLRERAIAPLLAPTSSTVVCIPDSVDLMNFTLPDVRLTLYVANVGKNIHFLRIPGMRHVFIGHGDSDKAASVNPFSKAYDEVWVAGPAGRERYARAKVGVRDESIREVGRPQLGPIEVSHDGGPREVREVLYAPTWEGWTNDPFHTSLVLMGPDLIRALVTSTTARVTYKPHPLTGTRDRAAQRAHDEIVGILGSANRTRAGDRHEVVEPTGRALYECFNQCDLLVSDISSVVADFLQSKKPYVVTNPAALPDEHFRAAYPTASAGYLIAPTGQTIVDVLGQVASEDPLGPARSALKEHLLGPDEPPPLERFIDAVTELVASGSAQPDAREMELAFDPEAESESSIDRVMGAAQ